MKVILPIKYLVGTYCRNTKDKENKRADRTQALC